MPHTRQRSTPWTQVPLDITTPAAGAGSSGVVVTDTPATYDNGLWTCKRLQADETLAGDGSTGWIFSYCTPGWASTAAPSTPYVFTLNRADRVAPLDCIELIFTSGQWKIQIYGNGSALSTPSYSASFSASTPTLLGTGWSPSHSYFSADGAAWASATRSAGAFSGSLDTFDIGSIAGASSFLDGASGWLAVGTGDPSAITPSDLSALGATPPFKYAWTSTMHPTALLDATGSVPRLWRWSAP